MHRPSFRHSLLLGICALALAACEESPKAGFTRNCTEVMTVMMDTMFKSDSVPPGARLAADTASADLCACRTGSIEALAEVSVEERHAFYREGLETEAISPQSRTLLKAALDKCGETFADALAAAVNDAKGEE